MLFLIIVLEFRTQAYTKASDRSGRSAVDTLGKPVGTDSHFGVEPVRQCLIEIEQVTGKHTQLEVLTSQLGVDGFRKRIGEGRLTQLDIAVVVNGILIQTIRFP